MVSKRILTAGTAVAALVLAASANAGSCQHYHIFRPTSLNRWPSRFRRPPTT